MYKALHRYSRKPAANGQIFLKSGRKSQAPTAHIYPNVSLGLAGLFRISPPPQKKNISQEMLAIARALMTQPRFIIMDEPSEGLAPAILDILVEFFNKLYAESNTRATPRNSARSLSQNFCPNSKFRKWRNTVCISHFWNCGSGAKRRLRLADAIVRCCPSILLVEQNLGFCQRITDRTNVMNTGTIAYSGSLKELRSDKILSKKLLGVG